MPLRICWVADMGDHLQNPLSRAKQNGAQIIKVTDLGDDFGLADIRLVPMFTDEGKTLAIGLCVLAGPMSKLVGIQPVPVMIGELGRISIEQLRSDVAKALQPPEQA